MHGCFFKKSTSYRFCRLIKRIVVIRFITRIFCRCHSFSCYFYVHTQPLFCVGVPSTNINFHRWLFYLFFFFFSLWVFFQNHSQITGLQGKGEGISITPHYHFHPLHIHLDISWAITAESSPLHIGSSRSASR